MAAIAVWRGSRLAPGAAATAARRRSSPGRRAGELRERIAREREAERVRDGRARRPRSARPEAAVRRARRPRERSPRRRGSPPGAGRAARRRHTVQLRCVPEDAHRRRAAARRRARARVRALPRRRQQPRLPRLLRAARGARDERGLLDQRAARLHEHALQAALRLPAEGRRRRLGHPAGAPARDRRHVQGRPPADARPPARAVPALPADRRGVRLPQPRVRGLGGRRRDRDARHARGRGRREDDGRLHRPRRVPARLRERLR